ncbi:GNAT family N-acetyltransferase [Deefgea tanakiae]|uniref:GNAT family N-acetyltransferase n=1 Tax=Deefgea tanakiae TaxID=2865840 RepID=A0ABX8Z6K6_9NEIS|nr:GNAT family N-acetyltransferase [Deefgea tanakiae]QZA77942.1 GNAT family N-acetyltransferase [Deefgea tanakiae]
MQSQLHTSRLVLRQFTDADFDSLFALTREAEISNILPDWKMTQEQMQSYLRCWVTQGYPHFDPAKPEMLYAICLGEQLIGWVGLWPKEGLDSPFPEVAYALSREHRGCGYASEAVKAACSELFIHCPDLPALVAIVKDWNTPSQRVVINAGFLPRGTATVQDDGEFDLFILPRPELSKIAAVTLRPALESEADLLAYIQKQAFLEHYQRWGAWNPSDSDAAGSAGHDSPHLLRHLIRTAHYFVIEIAGVVAGGICVEGPYANKAYVSWFFVDPAFGRQGIGRHALALVESHFPAVDCWNLGTSARSEDNARFYLSCGYQESAADNAFRYFTRQVRETAPPANHFNGQSIDKPCWSDSFFEQAQFYDCALPNFRLASSTMTDAHFHNVNVSGLCIGDARMARLELCHSSWGGAYLHDLGRGWHGDHDPVRMARVDLGYAQIEDCDLRGAHIQGGQLDGLKINGIPYAELLAAWVEIKSKAISQSKQRGNDDEN